MRLPTDNPETCAVPELDALMMLTPGQTMHQMLSTSRREPRVCLDLGSCTLSG